MHGRDGALVDGSAASRTASTGPASPLYVRGLAQALAVHLLRHYCDPHGSIRRSNALPAYKLRKVIGVMNERLAEEFSLAALAQVVELSEYHFSRMFKRATGLSPSQYFIGLRMARRGSCCLKRRAASSTSGWRWATEPQPFLPGVSS